MFQPTTGKKGESWQTVGKKKVKVTLHKEDNVIRLYNPQNWMPDIDYIDLEPTTPSGVHSATTSNAKSNTQAFDLSGRPAKNNALILIQHGKKILRR